MTNVTIPGVSYLNELVKPGTVLSGELGEGAMVRPSIAPNTDVYGCFGGLKFTGAKDLEEVGESVGEYYSGTTIPNTQNVSGVVIPSTGVEGYMPGVVMPTTTQLYGVDKKFLIGGGIGLVVLIASGIGIFFFMKRRKTSEGLLPEPVLP